MFQAAERTTEGYCNLNPSGYGYVRLHFTGTAGNPEDGTKAQEPQKKETDQQFIGEGGNCYSLSNFMTQLMIKVRKINSTVNNAKQIRASVPTKWVKMYNLRKAQYQAGHRYISSTESYLQNDVEGLKEEINKYHPLD